MGGHPSRLMHMKRFDPSLRPKATLSFGPFFPIQACIYLIWYMSQLCLCSWPMKRVKFGNIPITRLTSRKVSLWSMTLRTVLSCFLLLLIHPRLDLECNKYGTARYSALELSINTVVSYPAFSAEQQIKSLTNVIERLTVKIVQWAL